MKHWDCWETPVSTYFSWGDCFCAPGPEEAGMGPGWKAWLGEVVAERALWGEPWADWDGEAEAERCPPEAIWAHVELIYSTRTLLKLVLCCSTTKTKETWLLPRLGCVVCGWRRHRVISESCTWTRTQLTWCSETQNIVAIVRHGSSSICSVICVVHDTQNLSNTSSIIDDPQISGMMLWCTLTEDGWGVETPSSTWAILLMTSSVISCLSSSTCSPIRGMELSITCRENSQSGSL